MSTFVILVTYNALPWIDACLESVRDYPVVVVDNLSTDATVAHLKSHYPKVTVLPQATNLGFGQGNNVGIRYALDQGATSVFLLNQDAYMHPGSLSLLLEQQHKNPDYGILSPVHLNGTGTALDFNFSKYMQSSTEPSFYSDAVLGQSVSLYTVPFVNAAAWLIRLSCLERVGGFDPLFFHYGEDDNYCQRVLFHGFQIGVVRDAYVRHDREARQPQSILPGSLAYWTQKERNYKIRQGDIRVTPQFSQIEKKLQKKILFSVLKLRLSEARLALHELQLVRKIKPGILESRKLNTVLGPTHLR
ncbi:glycosyltransferase family 2 protein [Flavobacterium sp.]|uniref:glycosyltransferase family 2 protein n=1 Tax=Flavobacterium sp. TaxID=239 RepID=UPI002FDB2BB8